VLKLRSRTTAEGATVAPQRRPPKDTRRRFVDRRRARRRRILRWTLAGLLLVALVGTGVWLVFASSVLAVTGTEVRGTDVLSTGEVESVAQVPEDVPLATVDLDAIRARVEDLAAVKSADVSRSWPHTVRIDVTERRALAFVAWNGGWRGVDEAGVLFRDYDTRPTGMPEVKTMSTTPVEALAESAKIVAALPPAILDRVAFVQVGSIDDISLTLKNQSVVQWGSSDESADKAAVLRVLLDQPARSYDVTAPGRPTIPR